MDLGLNQTIVPSTIERNGSIYPQGWEKLGESERDFKQQNPAAEKVFGS